MEALLRFLLALQAELNYAPKGDVWYYTYASGRRTERRDVYNYLEIPLLAKYRLSDGAVSAYAVAGPYFALALSNHYFEDSEGTYYEGFTRGDFGLQLGGGASKTVGPGQAFAELRYSHGFQDIDVFRDGTPTRNRAFSLTVGYLYPLRSAKPKS